MALQFMPPDDDMAELIGVASDVERASIEAYQKHGSLAAAARALGRSKTAVQQAIARARRKLDERVVAVDSARVRLWLLTSAQDDTEVHRPFWNNLLTYARHIGAEIVVGGFTYQKGLYEDHQTRTAAFAAEVQLYLRHDNVDLGPAVFFAKMNILPTAIKPLSGLETHARGKHGIFPHAKIQLVSVPSTVTGVGYAHQMTTGACTVPNYIEKKAGQKAEFHHQIGATIVEVDGAGRFFARQIIATDDGSFQDLDVVVKRGEVTKGHRVEAITWGDVHREKIDPVVAQACWGIDVKTDTVEPGDTMLDVLRPRHQFFHDLLDFMTRNHHSRDNHHFRFRMIAQGTDRVEDGVAACARFLRLSERPWCVSVVVPSNHHDAYERWLREADPRKDPANALFWFRSNAAVYEAIERGDSDFDVFRWALIRADPREMEDIIFPPRGGSYVVCQAAGGIECAYHGDEGVNGARGSAQNLIRVASRMNIGHSHSPSILDGIYVAGLCGLMDQDYNNPTLSSWSHTQIVTYTSGKRTLVTLVDGKWRA